MLAVVSEPTPNDCNWTQDWEGNWETECGNVAVVGDGAPHENDMRFCWYCGGRLVEVPFAEDEVLDENDEEVKNV